METIKNKIIIALSVIAFILLLGILVYNLEYKTFTYYTQIDNDKISELDTTDVMKYEYHLKAYDDKGRGKQISFKTSRELRSDAYLKITYRYISGVNKWEEVEYTQLPSKVKNVYSDEK